MPASKRNLLIEKHATFKKRLTWRDSKKRPINLTGWSALLQVRESATAPAVLLELSTANGGVILDPLKGIIDLYLTDEQTAALTFASGVFDLIMTSPGGDVFRLIEGKVAVSLGVSQVAS